MSITNTMSEASYCTTDKRYMRFNPGVRRFIKNRYNRTIRHNWMKEVQAEMDYVDFEDELELTERLEFQREVENEQFWAECDPYHDEHYDDPYYWDCDENPRECMLDALFELDKWNRQRQDYEQFEAKLADDMMADEMIVYADVKSEVVQPDTFLPTLEQWRNRKAI